MSTGEDSSSYNERKEKIKKFPTHCISSYYWYTQRLRRKKDRKKKRNVSAWKREASSRTNEKY